MIRAMMLLALMTACQPDRDAAPPPPAPEAETVASLAEARQDAAVEEPKAPPTSAEPAAPDPASADPPRRIAGNPGIVAAARAQCEGTGGRWGPGGKGNLVCYRPTPDANKSCKTGTQCQGQCLARSMTCTPVVPLFGCNEILTDSGTRATLCRD